MPIPHKGPRGSPLTEVRHGAPAITMATATVAPTGTATRTPFTDTVICSGMHMLCSQTPGGQIWFERNQRRSSDKLIDKKMRGRQ
jgi:hypothetical protein